MRSKEVMVLVWVSIIAYCECACNKPVKAMLPAISYDEIVDFEGYYYLDNQLYTGVIYQDNPGLPLVVKKEFQVVKGLKNGYSREWMLDQVIRTEKQFVAGKEDGKQKGYHTNGNLSYEYTVVDGKKEGRYIENYPSGQLHIESTYEQDRIIAKKILDISGVTLTNYVIRDGRYYGFLGTSGCINVLNESDIEE